MKKLVLILTLIFCLSLLTSKPSPVYLDASSKDVLGKTLCEKFRTALTDTQNYVLVCEDADEMLSFRLRTKDPSPLSLLSSSRATMFSLTVIYTHKGYPVFISNIMGNCIKDKLDEGAAGMVEDVGKIIEMCNAEYPEFK